MPRNLEIKARAADPERQWEVAGELSGGQGELLVQTDTFFRAPSGRLKLREFADGSAELIQYHRPDASAPTESSYVRTPIPDPDGLRQALQSSLGLRCVVRKRRLLHRVGRTRVHLDEVDGLGAFIELEVVLAPDEPPSAAMAEAQDLMRQLGISEEDLVERAYADLLESSDPSD